MKKYVTLTLVILLLVCLAACMNESANNTGDDIELQSDLHPATLVQNENSRGLQAAQTSSNGFGVGFFVRNETGKQLYYNDDFRVDSLPMTNYHNHFGVQFISHGNTYEVHVNWATPLPTGMYTFEQDFFLD